MAVIFLFIFFTIPSWMLECEREREVDGVT